MRYCTNGLRRSEALRPEIRFNPYRYHSIMSVGATPHDSDFFEARLVDVEAKRAAPIIASKVTIEFWNYYTDEKPVKWVPNVSRTRP